MISRWVFGVASAVLALLIVSGIADAARNQEQAHIPHNGDILVVFETEDCIYCKLFRRDVLPDYLRSQRNRLTPIKFIDVTISGAKHPGLVTPLKMLPTVVLMRRGREVGRIPGYTGPGPFFQLMKQLYRQIPPTPESRAQHRR